jgi:hypothetical protein
MFLHRGAQRLPDVPRGASGAAEAQTGSLREPDYLPNRFLPDRPSVGVAAQISHQLTGRPLKITSHLYACYIVIDVVRAGYGASSKRRSVVVSTQKEACS